MVFIVYTMEIQKQRKRRYRTFKSWVLSDLPDWSLDQMSSLSSKMVRSFAILKILFSLYSNSRDALILQCRWQLFSDINKRVGSNNHVGRIFSKNLIIVYVNFFFILLIQIPNIHLKAIMLTNSWSQSLKNTCFCTNRALKQKIVKKFENICL